MHFNQLYYILAVTDTMIVIFFDSQLLLDARRDEISVFFKDYLKKKNLHKSTKNSELEANFFCFYCSRRWGWGILYMNDDFNYYQSLFYH
jgi:hypothetical protein